MSSISTCLWFQDNNGYEAAQFYVSLIPNSEILHVLRTGPDQTPLMTEFSLDGTVYQALNGGKHFKLSEAASIVVTTPDQAGTDRLWDALTANGGRESHGGWLVDCFGVSWQIIPQAWVDICKSEDKDAVTRAFGAMMTMGKLDIAALKQAFEGTGE